MPFNGYEVRTPCTFVTNNNWPFISKVYLKTRLANFVVISISSWDSENELLCQFVYLTEYDKSEVKQL